MKATEIIKSEAITDNLKDLLGEVGIMEECSMKDLVQIIGDLVFGKQRAQKKREAYVKRLLEMKRQDQETIQLKEQK